MGEGRFNNTKWLCKPRKIQNRQRGEEGVGFLIQECLLPEVEFITNINLEESAWIKVLCTLDAFICLQLLLVLPRWMPAMKTLRMM